MSVFLHPSVYLLLLHCKTILPNVLTTAKANYHNHISIVVTPFLGEGGDYIVYK